MLCRIWYLCWDEPKYGFDPEDIEWIGDIVVSIDENGIIFKDDVSELSRMQMKVISRYL